MLPSNPTAEQWQLEFAQALPELEELSVTRAAPWPLRVLRSSQLDAQRLDAELQTMLQEQFMAVFQLLPQGQVSSLEPELNLMLSALVWFLSVWQGKATPGAELMNLRYRNERAMDAAATAAKALNGTQQQAPPWLHGGRTGVAGPDLSTRQRCAYAAGFVALPYLWLRVHRAAAGWGWGQDPDNRLGMTCWRLLRALDAAHKLCMLVNLWVFLYQGKYRTLVERLVGARLVYRNPSLSRLVSFEYLNRQLVWQELSEFLLFLLPLINVTKVRKAVLKLLPKLPVLTAGSTGSAGLPGGREYPVAAPQQHPLPAAAGKAAAPTSSSSATHEELQPLQRNVPLSCQAGHQSAPCDISSGAADSSSVDVSQLLQPVGPCPICSSRDILVPFVALPCRHIFCYYCLQGHCAADSEFQCPVDGVRVDALQRYVRVMPPAVS